MNPKRSVWSIIPVWIILGLFAGYSALADGIIPDKLMPWKISLRAAVERGDAKKVSKLLEEGADPTVREGTEKPLLHVAVRAGYLEVAGLLILNGADPDEGDDVGRTALHMAVQECNRDMINMLLVNGANVNALDEVIRKWVVMDGHKLAYFPKMFPNVKEEDLVIDGPYSPLDLCDCKSDDIRNLLLEKGAKSAKDLVTPKPVRTTEPDNTPEPAQSPQPKTQ